MTQHVAPSSPAVQEWHVTQCACGHLTLRLGTVRIDFSREEFSQLHQLVQQSMAEFRVAPGEPAVTRAIAH